MTPGTIQRTLLVLVVLAGAAIRFEAIEARGISHPEVYVPGIALPAGISAPPPRISFGETLRYHIADEVHPPGWFYAMWPWTKVAGTSLFALRLPSVLFGIATIVLLYFAVARSFGATAGIVAAALLAFNGHHVLWSDKARMYALAAMLSVLSTWLWLEWLRSEGNPRGVAIGYAVATAAGLCTQLYFWLLLAGHMAYAVWRGASQPRMKRVLSVQGAITIAGAPLLAHAAYHDEGQRYEALSLSFAQDFLDFGFLFRPDHWSAVARDAPFWVEVVSTGIALAALFAFLRRRPVEEPETREAALRERTLWLLGVASALCIAWLASLAGDRAASVGAVALVPLAVVPMLRFVSRWKPHLPAADARLPGLASPWLFAALLPVAGLAAASLVRPLLLPRGLLLFVPLQLGVLAVGLVRLSQTRVVAVALAVGVGALHLASVAYYRELPNPNDYRGLAESLREVLEPGDLVFAHANSWATTPVFYHLEGERARIVASDFGERLRASPEARVWVLLFSDQRLSPEMRDALAGHRRQGARGALRSRAILFVPVAEADPPAA